MVMGNLLLLMGSLTKATIKMIESMDMAFFLGLMENDTKVGGVMENKMAMES